MKRAACKATVTGVHKTPRGVANCPKCRNSITLPVAALAISPPGEIERQKTRLARLLESSETWTSLSVNRALSEFDFTVTIEDKTRLAEDVHSADSRTLDGVHPDVIDAVKSFYIPWVKDQGAMSRIISSQSDSRLLTRIASSAKLNTVNKASLISRVMETTDFASERREIFDSMVDREVPDFLFERIVKNSDAVGLLQIASSSRISEDRLMSLVGTGHDLNMLRIASQRAGKNMSEGAVTSLFEMCHKGSSRGYYEVQKNIAWGIHGDAASESLLSSLVSTSDDDAIMATIIAHKDVTRPTVRLAEVAIAEERVEDPEGNLSESIRKAQLRILSSDFCSPGESLTDDALNHLLASGNWHELTSDSPEVSISIDIFGTVES